jgi:maltokinase
VHGAGATLALTDRTALVLNPDGDRWSCSLHPEGATGAAERLVEHLWRGRALPDGDFRLSRHAVPPAASGERPVTVDQTNSSVVVGERVVVKWMRHVHDAPHPAPTTLAHLAETGFKGVPKCYGLLLWQAPSGREVPCAVVSAYLPGASDGWTWAVDLIERAIGPADGASAAPWTDPWIDEFPARLGELAARLHCELATPSSVLPEPTSTASPETVRSWQAAAADLFEQAEVAVTGLDDAPAGPDGDAPAVPPSHLFAQARDRIAAAIDGLAGSAEPGGTTTVQRIHGDLHVGQVLRWSGGLAVIDFDGNPILTGPRDAPEATARDVAQLLVSLDQAGRIADRRSGFTRTDDIDEWSAKARATLLAAYREEIGAYGCRGLFDERLLAPFVAEQVCRDILYSARYLPRWAYAVTGGLGTLLAGEPATH